MSLLVKGVTEFVKLKDTPVTYTGQGGKFPQVNPGETALQFAAGGLSVWTRVFNGAVDTPTATVWGYDTDMPLPARFEGSAAESAGLIYQMGGHAADNSKVSDVDYYDPDTKTWASKTDIPGGVPRFDQAPSVAVGGVIYLMHAVTMYAFDISADTWTAKAVASGGAQGIPAGAVGNNAYFVIDGPPANYFARVTVYDTVGDGYTDKVLCARNHKDGGGGWVTNTMYALGPSASCDSWTEDAWTAKADMPVNQRVDNFGSALLDSTIYTFGGGPRATPIKVTNAYDTVGNSWTAKEDMPEVRTFIGTNCVPYGGSAYCLGGVKGYSDTTYNAQKTTLKFTPAQVYLLWSGTLNMGDAVAIYRPGGTATVYSDGKVYLISGSGCVFPIFTDNCPVRVEIPYVEDYKDTEVWTGEVA